MHHFLGPNLGIFLMILGVFLIVWTIKWFCKYEKSPLERALDDWDDYETQSMIEEEEFERNLEIKWQEDKRKAFLASVLSIEEMEWL